MKLKTHTKLSPNFLTLPENLRRGQIVGDTSSQHFSQSTSSKYVHCSALIVTDVGRNMGGGLHLPHGPKLLARQLAKRRGIPRNSRCKKEYGCPWDGTVYEVSSCPTRCLYWVTVMYLPACKSSIARAQVHTRAYEIQYCVPMNMRNQKLLRTSCNNYSRSARSRPMILSYFAHAAVAAQITTPFCLKLLRAFGFSTKELWRKSGVVKFPKVNI